ncbi:bromoperoxidase [Mameliella sediminis]|uniref:bromoperoxidase n=1 Tax=Mameliella sediminis TaxID=2836866 RepID=UPI001C456D48|nr:bromoperoxidase [Mameliella sediminis]MBV7394770.1 bromoperoxidase [Mameliella sediminis]MBY6163219.1 bromoperoxidase [Mameliella alba]MBY6171483.1 bromoperoxidase [Mameliella alba]MBY6176707.1 bromoperoxidase [Mameliella alba]
MAGKSSKARFGVIHGDGKGKSLRDRITLPPAPSLSAAELAADMAEIFALGLVQDLRAEALQDPHCAVRIDGATRFTMHELLCELRNLGWFDGGAAARQAATESGQDEAAQRRALRRNAEGQFTLRSLLRGGVALRGGGPVLSAFWDSDHMVSTTPRAAGEWPSEDAPLSEWIGWCADHSRAGLQLPWSAVLPPLDPSLGDRAAALHRTPAARPFHNAALIALARGMAMASGLPGPELWTGSRLMSLMAEGESLACQFVQAQAAQKGRLSRPAVVAAQMTAWLSQDDRAVAGGEGYRIAAEELAAAAPNLLHWVSRANRARRGPQRSDPALFLPLAGPERQHLNPSDLGAHVVVAGVLATLIKAVFDTSRRTQLQPVGQRAPALALEDQADRLAANIGLLRCVSGGFFPSENIQDLRLGQAIALHLLRDRMEQDNRSADLSFRDFDGQSLHVQAHPRRFGRGYAELRRDGTPVAWPQEARHPAAHLTAVS